MHKNNYYDLDENLNNFYRNKFDNNYRNSSTKIKTINNNIMNNFENCEENEEQNYINIKNNEIELENKYNFIFENKYIMAISNNNININNYKLTQNQFFKPNKNNVFF